MISLQSETPAKLRHSGESRPRLRDGTSIQRGWANGGLPDFHSVRCPPMGFAGVSAKQGEGMVVVNRVRRFDSPSFQRDHCKTSRTSLFRAAELAREAQRSRNSRFPTRQTQSKPPLIPP